MPYATAENLEKFIQPLSDAMARFNINTVSRMSIFLAQIAHESGCLKYTKEIATGEAYDTGSLATSLGNTPEKDGDGQRYKGRGLIQITGTRNYKKLGEYFGQDFLKSPELLEGPVWASMSAAWFWWNRGLNAYVDLPDTWSREYRGNTYNKFTWITLLINGGQNGIVERLKYYELAKKALAI